MKIGQKFTLLSLITLLQVAQLCGTTSWNVEVDGTDTGNITQGVTVGTIIKKGTGTLNVSGLQYDVDGIEVDEGKVYVNDAPDLYITNSITGAFIPQPATLLSSILFNGAIYNDVIYWTKLMAFFVDVPTGTAYIENTIISPLLDKIGAGTANFMTKLITHYLKISAGIAIIRYDGVPSVSVQLGATLQPSTNLLNETGSAAIPNVTMISNGTISNTFGYAVEMLSLALEGFVLITNNASTVVDSLDATTAGGTISNADQLTLNGAQGNNPVTKEGIGTMIAAEDLSDSAIPLDVLSGTLQVVGNGKLPTAPVTIDATDGGSTFELSASDTAGIPTAGAVPGPMEVQSGCTLLVDANLTVPANTDAKDVFTGGLKMRPGSILELGDGVVWMRPINVGLLMAHSPS